MLAGIRNGLRRLGPELEDRTFSGGLVLASLAVGELALTGSSPVILLWGGCVAWIAGGLLGFAAASGERAARLLPRWAQLLLHLLLACAIAAVVAVDLDAFAKLSGTYERLAWIALGASLGLGLLCAGASFAQQSSRTEPGGWLASRGPRIRWAGRGLLLVSAGALIWVDLNAFPLTYPSAHHALRWATWWTLVALVWTFPGRPRFASSPKVRIGLRLTAAFAIAFPVITLTPDERPAVHTLVNGRFSGRSMRLVRTLTDVDGDGYAMVIAGGDCAPFDPKVNPGADEIPGNGIDENCLLGDASTSRQAQEVPPKPTEPSPVSVVLVTIDTLRPDRMSLYGARRSTTPRIAAWAKSALRYEHAYSAGAWTSLSLSSLFRGLYPRRLEWGWVYETNRLRLLTKPFEGKLRSQEKPIKTFAVPLRDENITLGKLLSRRGMRTVAVVDDSRSQFLEPEMNIAGEFDDYSLIEHVRGIPRDDDGVTKLAIRKLKKLAQSPEPFFLWAHYFGPHEDPRAKHGKNRYGEGPADRYDHKLRYTDRQVGEFLERVDELAKNRPLAVVLTADHGERFRKANRGHGGDLTDANVHVPLLVRGPGFEPGVTDQLASVTDVFPTILQWTATPAPDGLDGIALQTTHEKGHRPPVISETWRFKPDRGLGTDLVAASDGDYRVVMDLVGSSENLFAPASDAAGEKNLVHEVRRPELFRQLNQYLEENRSVRVKEPNESPIKGDQTRIQASRPK